MKDFIRKWALAALLAVSAVTAPWLALGAYNITQNPNGSTGFLDSLSASGINIITFINGRVSQTATAQGEGAKTWAFDEKSYTLTFADLGTATDLSLVIDETGTIEEVSVAWNQTLSTASAVLQMYRVVRGGSFTANNTGVSTFSLTATTSAGGGMVTDDIIFQAVNRGDTISIATDGGPSNVVPGVVTIRIRALSVQ